MELLWWKSFFDIHPWTYEREELNAARIAAFVFNSSLRAKQRIRVDELLPAYLKHKPVQYVHKSRAEQRSEFGSFTAKLKALKKLRKKRKRNEPGDVSPTTEN